MTQTHCADRPSREMFFNGKASRDLEPSEPEGFRADLIANLVGALCYSWVTEPDRNVVRQGATMLTATQRGRRGHRS